MSAQHLEQLEDDIKLLRDQLAGKRRTLVTIAPEEHVRIEQQIAELRKKIRDFEQEKWELIAQITSSSDIANDEAEVVVAELIAEGAAIATNPAQSFKLCSTNI
jgi:phage shock protein A